ncbi:hypothetical protein L1987_46480 [Smallanthus sonchifolius]|uniref:Uncharacterized protein n=1 Tax=Smallanthus sonchifolius TaxID=185202 RepID=A0ACB9FZV8_9ASTR|nr:hypothetical protein L1987_46480 [Smallanthus sonchifolius]
MSRLAALKEFAFMKEVMGSTCIFIALHRSFDTPQMFSSCILQEIISTSIGNYRLHYNVAGSGQFRQFLLI